MTQSILKNFPRIWQITFELGSQRMSFASEGAILTMPDGAFQEEPGNLSKFRHYVVVHVASWYKFVNWEWRCSCSRWIRQIYFLGDGHVCKHQLSPTIQFSFESHPRRLDNSNHNTTPVLLMLGNILVLFQWKLDPKSVSIRSGKNTHWDWKLHIKTTNEMETVCCSFHIDACLSPDHC